MNRLTHGSGCMKAPTIWAHEEFVPPGQTVNQHFYREVLERPRKHIAHVRPDIKEKMGTAPQQCTLSQ